MKALAVVLILLTGCTVQLPRPVFIDNGAAIRNGVILRACAMEVRRLLYINPHLPGDLMFRHCYLTNGVRAI